MTTPLVSDIASARVAVAAGNLDTVLTPLSGAAPLFPVEQAVSFAALAVSRRGGAQSRIATPAAAAVTPTLSIANASVIEGNPGQKTLSFAVILSSASASTVMVAYQTAGGTATSGQDFLAVADALTFAPGVTSQQINVSVIGDTAVESDETFTVNLYGAMGATLGTATATGTITNDDGVKSLPTITISGISNVPEGNSGYASANFLVTLSAASSTPVTVQYQTGPSSAFPATAGADYLAITTPKTLTFNPGETKKSALVSVIGDTIVESNERFTVTLSNPSGATIAQGSADAIITNDDTPPVVSLSPSTVSVTEGNSGTTKATFTVALANGATATNDVTVNYATTAGGAKADKDFEAISLTSPGSVTILKGSNSATFYVRVIGDYDKESDETFTVGLTSASMATLGTAKTSTVTIRDDDVAGNASPVVSIADVSVDEGNSGTKNAVFTVSLSRSAASPVTVQWATSDGTAKAGSDYTAGSGTLTFAAGVTSQTVNVAVKGDTAVESDETFAVALSNPFGLKLGTATATGTIRNDEIPVAALSPATVGVTEGNSGTTKAVFTVVLSRAAASPVTVKWATNDGTAKAGSDYTSAIGTLTFAAGVTSQTFEVAVAGDTAVESDETFTVELVAPSGLTLGTASRATVTIRNDDTAAPVFTVSPSATTLNEGQTLTTTISAGSSSAGTTLYWRVEQPTAGGVTVGDFSSGALQGSGVLSRTTSGSQLSVTHTLGMDWSTVKPGTYPGAFALSPSPLEGNEQILISFYSDPAFKNLVKSTPLITIKDTARSAVNTDWAGASFQKLTKDANGVYSVANVNGNVTFTSTYYKYYGQGKEKTQVMLEQPWIPGRPTIVFAHGWRDSAGLGWKDSGKTADPNSTSQLLFNALHERYGATHNILLVDWSTLAADTAVNPPNTPALLGEKQPTAEITVTKQVGETIARMLLDNNVDPAQLTLIGHSLGSYVMGAAASYIAAKSPTKVALLVGLDPAYGVQYDIDARNGWGETGKTYNDPPIPFTTAIATATRTYTASDLVAEGKLAGDNVRASLAQRAYLVQYTKTAFNPTSISDVAAANADYHNAVIAIYADLVRKGIEDPPYSLVDRFDAYGKPQAGGPFDGVIVAAQPWITTPTGFLAPKAIGWGTGYNQITIYGSPKSDILFHDRFELLQSTGGTTFRAGDGDDFLVGGSKWSQLYDIGIDQLYGEKGSDTFVFGYRRYGDNLLPYDDKWSTDFLGSGLGSYAVIKDFNPQEDKLYLAISKADLRFRKAGDIAGLGGEGVGLLYSNGDLFAYIPGLSYDAASAFLNSSKTVYSVQLDLDRDLFQNIPRTSEFFG